MKRKVVVEAIKKIILDIKEKCIIKNIAIKDSIFGILENECTVIYYPLESEYLEAAARKKQLEKLVLPVGQDVFSYRKAAMSLGDVHMILMAFFARMPIVLTEDSDIGILRSITKRIMGSETYTLNIYNAVDLLIMIAEKDKSDFNKNDLVDIVKSIGERKHQSDVKQAWNRTHIDT